MTTADAGVAPTETVDGGQVTTVTPPDANAICVAYKQSSKVDKTTAKPTPPTHSGAGPIYDSAYWDPTRKVTLCTLVRDSVAGNVEVLHTPTCCPQGRGNTPCPGPSKVTVPGTKFLVERVTVGADGKAIKDSLQWFAVESQPEPRHNCGRRPEGLRFGNATSSDDEIGAQLAAMAELEAASVPAFDRLARELAMHDAPADLVRRARLAMGDEVRHARVMRELAAQYGSAPRAIDVPPLPCRTLAAIARENAIEGCVREAYGALVATYQAACAAPALRAAFGAIADDERRHAALSEDVDAWITSQLDAAALADVVAARITAQQELRASLIDAPPCASLGLPGGADAVALFDAYFTRERAEARG